MLQCKLPKQGLQNNAIYKHMYSIYIQWYLSEVNIQRFINLLLYILLLHSNESELMSEFNESEFSLNPLIFFHHVLNEYVFVYWGLEVNSMYTESYIALYLHHDHGVHHFLHYQDQDLPFINFNHHLYPKLHIEEI